MFKVYDLNFTEIPLPKDNLKYGIIGPELYMSSISRRVMSGEVPGLPGGVRSHVQDGTRTIDMRIVIDAMDEQDFKLKRNRLYTFFRRLGDFYIAEEYEPNKLLKVSLDDSYMPENPVGVGRWARVDIPLAIVGLPYRISRYSSLDIHNNDIQFDGKWSAGMHLPPVGETVDGITFDYQYVFENQRDIQVFNPSDIDLYIKQHLDMSIKFECLQSMSAIRLLDARSKEFVFTDDLVAGDVVEIQGHRILKNGRLSAEHANDIYPTLLSNFDEVYQEYSINKIRISAGLKVTFDFRYKYD